MKGAGILLAVLLLSSCSVVQTPSFEAKEIIPAPTKHNNFLLFQDTQKLDVTHTRMTYL